MKLFSPDIEDLTDEELLVQYRKRNSMHVIGILYNRYTHLVYGLCLKYLKSREDAQDAVMSIFELLPEKLKKHEVKFFKSWLYIVATNHCLILLRKRAGTEKTNGRFMENEELTHLLFEEDNIGNDLVALQACLEELRSDQRICVSLFYLNEKSYQDIVEQTSFKLNKVKSYIQNGKRNLRICLEKKHVTR